MSKVYHICNYNDYDLPFKVMIKFFDLLALDEAWGNYPNKTIKNIAKDRCILLNIKLQSCNFYFNGDIFNPFILQDYSHVNNNTIYIVNKNIPIDLTENNFIFDCTFLNGAIINNVVRDLDRSICGTDIDIIFEYKFISEVDYQSKINEIK
uniref:Uncharacterized protein n=1 Tax=Porodaedalea pini TaxID=108901 RepID=A0A5B9RAJ5_9AGAM|nr:hypothetical protein PPIT_000045 [Porodaedalea pini]QEG56926.1 hypothetical protein PPIT_000045 [Porodaedalea pini]